MKILKALAVVALVLGSTYLFAQGGPPDPGGDGDPVGAPLDGGIITFLVGAGISYFSYKKKRK